MPLLGRGVARRRGGIGVGNFEDVANWDARPLGRDDGHAIRLADTGSIYQMKVQLTGKGAGSEYVRPFVYDQGVTWEQRLVGDFLPGTVVTPQTDFVRGTASGGSVSLITSPPRIRIDGSGASIDTAFVRWAHGLSASPKIVVQGYFAVAVTATTTSGDNAVVRIGDNTRRFHFGWGRGTAEEFHVIDSGNAVQDGFFVDGGGNPLAFSAERYLEMFFEGDEFCYAYVSNSARPEGGWTYTDMVASATTNVDIGDFSTLGQGRVDIRDLFVGVYT